MMFFTFYLSELMSLVKTIKLKNSEKNRPLVSFNTIIYL